MKNMLLLLSLLIGYNAIAQELPTVVNAIPQEEISELEIAQYIDEIKDIPGVTDIRQIKRNIIGEEQRSTAFISLYLNGKNYVQSISAQLAQSELFRSIEQDVPGKLHSIDSVNDPGFYLQWGFENDGSRTNSKAGADISMIEAWNITTGDTNIIVGFLDSGTEPSLMDFQGRIWQNTGEIPGDSIDNDGNGYIDDTIGWSTFDDSPNVHDVINHGTLINGIVGANTDNNNAFAGMNWHCKLMNIKAVNNSGFGLNSWWAEGIYYLVDNGAKVINASLGSAADLQVLKDAVDYAYANNVLIVASSGNNSTTPIEYPAAYDSVIAVGASDHADVRATWNVTAGSNYGPKLDVIAPGKAIYGLYFANESYLQYTTAGTSEAAPHVSGLASLIYTMAPGISLDSVTQLIRKHAEDTLGLANEDTPGFDHYHGYGRINAWKTLSALMPDTTTVDTSGSDTMNTSFHDLNAASVLVYPNPAKEYLEIKVANPGNYQFELYNFLGQKIHTETIDNEKLVLKTIELSGRHLWIIRENGIRIRSGIIEINPR